MLAELTSALAGLGTPARVRLRLRRDGTIGVDVEPAPDPDSGPVRVAVHPEPVDPRRWWLYHKTSMREPYERRRLARPDLDDVLLVNEAGELTEATRANLAVHLDGSWCTPPVAAGCLPGVERGRLLDAGRLRERPLPVADLARADGLGADQLAARLAAGDRRPLIGGPGATGQGLRPIPP